MLGCLHLDLSRPMQLLFCAYRRRMLAQAVENSLCVKCVMCVMCLMWESVVPVVSPICGVDRGHIGSMKSGLHHFPGLLTLLIRFPLAPGEEPIRGLSGFPDLPFPQSHDILLPVRTFEHWNDSRPRSVRTSLLRPVHPLQPLQRKVRYAANKGRR